MKSWFPYPLSVLLVVLLMAPAIIRLEHRHHTVVTKHNSGEQVERSLEKCYLCRFEYSFFSGQSGLQPSPSLPFDRFDRNENTENTPSAGPHAYSRLRGPPAVTA